MITWGASWGRASAKEQAQGSYRTGWRIRNLIGCLRWKRAFFIRNLDCYQNAVMRVIGARALGGLFRALFNCVMDLKMSTEEGHGRKGEGRTVI